MIKAVQSVACSAIGSRQWQKWPDQLTVAKVARSTQLALFFPTYYLSDAISNNLKQIRLRRMNALLKMDVLVSLIFRPALPSKGHGKQTSEVGGSGN